MPSRNVSLTEELDRYVEQSVKSGYYDNASEVIRAGLRALIQSEEEDRAKVEWLRTALKEGMEGPFLDGATVMEEMREHIRQRAEANRRKTAVA